MTYTIAGGEVFNMVLTHPEDKDPSTWNQRDLLSEMKSTYEGWDRTYVSNLNQLRHDDADHIKLD